MKFKLSNVIIAIAIFLLPKSNFAQDLNVASNDELTQLTATELSEINGLMQPAVFALPANSGETILIDFSKDADEDGVKDKKDECPDTPAGVAVDENGCPLDSDNDNVADYLDKCAMSPGLAKLNGCPDQDKDDVADIDDACPEVPGLARFQGCPDSDNDGIQDALDKCPNLKGLDRFNGCPDTDNDGVDDTNDKCPGTEQGLRVDANGCASDSDRDGIIDSDDKCPDTPKGIKVDAKGCPADTDGDGVIDTNDKCPTTKGEGSANGCPSVKPDVEKRLNFAARGIEFESGKATLKSSSNAMLDEVVSILKEYTDYNLQINGHTDNVGGVDMNMTLSQQRIDAVKAYLFAKGVPSARLEAKGYGETNPVASNDNEAGRAKNRRVELKLFIK